jgi:ABC-type multidrug transport system permease subunit
VTLRLEIEPGSFQPALDAARVKIYKSVGRLIGNLCLMSTFPETADSEAVELAYARAADLEARVTLESSFAGQGKVVPSGYNLTVPGTIVMSIIFSVMTFGTAQFAQDRHSGLLRRLVTTPSLGRDILLGKLLGRVLLGFLQIIVLLVLSRLIFKVYLGHSVLAWFVCLVPYTLACAALGLFMGCIFRSEEQAGILGWIPAILMAALGGCWWPRELAPDFLNTIGYCFPPAWAVDGLQRIISYGDGPQAVLPHAAVQCAFFVLFMGLCIRFFRYD